MAELVSQASHWEFIADDSTTIDHSHRIQAFAQSNHRCFRVLQLYCGRHKQAVASMEIGCVRWFFSEYNEYAQRSSWSCTLVFHSSKLGSQVALSSKSIFSGLDYALIEQYIGRSPSAFGHTERQNESFSKAASVASLAFASGIHG